jgi:hypothetical protein
MTIWTKQKFREKSHKYFSLRDGTIAEIDTALDEYHMSVQTHLEDAKLDALYRLVRDFQDEKALKYQNNPGGQSKKRKNGVAQLKAQVEAELWQRDYDGKAKERADFQAYFQDQRKYDEDVEVLTDWLEKLKMQVKQGDAATNDLKRKLHKAIETFFDPNGVRAWQAKYDNAVGVWNGGYIVNDQYQLADPVRVASVDLNSVVDGGPVKYVRFGSAAKKDWAAESELKCMFGKCKAGLDAIVGPKQSEHQVAEALPKPARKLLEDYLTSLLTVDLAEQVQLIKRALSTQAGYRSVVHIDYYATRSTTQVGLHKDTAGNNVFAVLHYLNDAPMLGPEYIDDPAPIKTVVDGYYPSHLYSKLDDKYRRQSAPWAVLKKSQIVQKDWRYVREHYCTWPAKFLDALHYARHSDKDLSARGKMASSILPKDGLVSFVDELIFHATPIEGFRVDPDTEASEDKKAAALRSVNAGVTVVSMLSNGGSFTGSVNLFGQRDYAHRVQRRMSAHYRNGVHLETDLAIPGATSGGVRRFFRLWICVMPENWYEPLPAYT